MRRPQTPTAAPQKHDDIAVALSYQRGVEPAPRIAAAGHGPVARQIVELAFANGVAVREDADLAGLLGELEIDSVIPLPAFAAVAEILAYLYRLNGTTQPTGGPS